MVKRWLILGLLAAVPANAATLDADWRFASLDGGTIDLRAHDGPILLVNTASLCAYTPQYDALEDLHAAYGPRGLLVVAVPSNDFRQELQDEDAVAEFCEVNFDLTLLITAITSVRGEAAHPVFADLKDEYGVAPRWNFNKFLIDDGKLAGNWGAPVRPGSREITRAIEAALK
ncbi:glutathione peroxidase [Maribius pontilimi]|uniref:Glutathione peroxidase n=1 Tax=Palleronia pontilimi TaxID=1964209 RepID=A0A934MHN0_9RHOB|nr:glutathione peroxidase [Palleronia pontilimi]MBJ3763459.1 glutathione peroxidase [Palleronia pontilimi]